MSLTLRVMLTLTAELTIGNVLLQGKNHSLHEAYALSLRECSSFSRWQSEQSPRGYPLHGCRIGHYGCGGKRAFSQSENNGDSLQSRIGEPKTKKLKIKVRSARDSNPGVR